MGLITKLLLLNVVSIFISFFSFAQTAEQYYKAGYEKNKNKDYDSCVILFTKAIKLKPNNADFYVARGDSKAHLKMYKEAMQDYAIALKLDSNNSVAYYNIACLYSFKKDAVNGFLYLQKAIDKGFDEKNDLMYYLKNDPDLNFIRSQKKFSQLIQKYE